MHVLPSAPHTMALGKTRLVRTGQTIRFGSVRYSTPPGLVDAEVWVRVAGAELVIVADLDALPAAPSWAAGRRGLVEVARHATSTPGSLRNWCFFRWSRRALSKPIWALYRTEGIQRIPHFATVAGVSRYRSVIVTRCAPEGCCRAPAFRREGHFSPLEHFW